MLGADRGVVEARRNRVRQLDVAVRVLEHPGASALQDSDGAAGESRRVASRHDALAPGLDANEPHAGVADEGVEDAHRVAAAADTRDDRVREPADPLEHLRARLTADDRLELAHHQRIGMRTEDAAEQIVRVGHVGDPVAHRLVDGVFQRPASRIHLADLGAKQPHAQHVRRLPRHVFRAHVDDAFEAEQRAGRRAGDAVLSRARLRDDAPLAHPAGQQRLPQGVVDLVRARVRQVFALQEDPRAARLRRQAPRLVERRGPADVVGQQVVELGEERLVLTDAVILALELLDRRHERLGHEPAAERAVVSACVGIAMAEHEPFGGDVQAHLCLHTRKRVEQRAQLLGILDAGRRLDARRHVDAGGPDACDGVSDICRPEAARQNDVAGRARWPRRDPSR